MIYAIFIVILLFLTLHLALSHVHARRRSFQTWEQIVGRLKPVRTEGITLLALELLQPESCPIPRMPNEVWELVGGIKGLRSMRDNSDVLISLAGYAQEWSPIQGPITAERMRRDGLALRRAVIGLGFATALGHGSKQASICAQEIAGSYYLMRQRLLTVYEGSQSHVYYVVLKAKV